MTEQEEAAYVRGQQALAARLIGELAGEATGEVSDLGRLIVEREAVISALCSCCEELGLEFDPARAPADTIRDIEQQCQRLEER